jgi:hypothetical protein
MKHRWQGMTNQTTHWLALFVRQGKKQHRHQRLADLSAPNGRVMQVRQAKLELPPDSKQPFKLETLPELRKPFTATHHAHANYQNDVNLAQPACPAAQG